MFRRRGAAEEKLADAEGPFPPGWPRRPRVAVVGAGVAGLSAAMHLKVKAGADVTIFDPHTHVGGSVRTFKERGFTVEAGPNSMQETSRRVAGIIRELGLVGEKVPVTGGQAMHVRDGRPVPFPSGPLSLLTTPLLSVKAKVKIVTEPFRWRRKGEGIRGRKGETADERERAGAGREAAGAGREAVDVGETLSASAPNRLSGWKGGQSVVPDESVATFFGRHFGNEVVDYLVDPLCVSNFGSAAGDLAIKHALPEWYDLEERHGSLVNGALFQLTFGSAAKIFPGARGTFSFKGGMHTLPKAMALHIGEGRVKLRKKVTSLKRDPVPTGPGKNQAKKGQIPPRGMWALEVQEEAQKWAPRGGQFGDWGGASEKEFQMLQSLQNDLEEVERASSTGAGPGTTAGVGPGASGGASTRPSAGPQAAAGGAGAWSEHGIFGGYYDAVVLAAPVHSLRDMSLTSLGESSPLSRYLPEVAYAPLSLLVMGFKDAKPPEQTVRSALYEANLQAEKELAKKRAKLAKGGGGGVSATLSGRGGGGRFGGGSSQAAQGAPRDLQRDRDGGESSGGAGSASDEETDERSESARALDKAIAQAGRKQLPGKNDEGVQGGVLGGKGWLGLAGRPPLLAVSGASAIVVPRKEGFNVLAATINSRLFPGYRCPDPSDAVPSGGSRASSYELLTAMVGGSRNADVAGADTEDLLGMIQRELSAMGIVSARDSGLSYLKHIYWERGFPVYSRGYGSVLRAIDRVESSQPGLFVCGNDRGALSVGKAIDSGDLAGRRCTTYLDQLRREHVQATKNATVNEGRKRWGSDR